MQFKAAVVPLFRARHRPDGMSLEMLGIHEFWLFVAAGMLPNVAPGPDTA
jgi:hypothetical protein